MSEETMAKTEGLNWQRLVITAGIVLVTAAAVGGTVWYLMDQQQRKQDIVSENKTSDSQESTVKSPGAVTPPTIDSYKDKVLISANDTFSVYAINDPVTTGNITESDIVIYNRNTNVAAKMEDKYSYFAAVMTFSDSAGEYVLLSGGSSPMRAGTVYSLSTKKIVAKNFTFIGKVIFWDNFLVSKIIEKNISRDTSSDLNNGVSLVAFNLKTGQTRVIGQADSLNDYADIWVAGRFGEPQVDYYDTNAKSVQGLLSFAHFTVTKAQDWADNMTPKGTTETYNLNNLLK